MFILILVVAYLLSQVGVFVIVHFGPIYPRAIGIGLLGLICCCVLFSIYAVVDMVRD